MEHGHGEGKRMTREQQEAIAVLQEFYDYNKTLTPHGESWLQADITINRETQRNLAEALPLAIEAMSRLLTDPATGLKAACSAKRWTITKHYRLTPHLRTSTRRRLCHGYTRLAIHIRGQHQRITGTESLR